MTPTEYGTELARKAKAAGFELADWQVELGARVLAQVDVDELKAMADTLGVKPSELVRGAESPA